MALMPESSEQPGVVGIRRSTGRRDPPPGEPADDYSAKAGSLGIGRLARQHGMFDGTKELALPPKVD
jgi:hypothetical protein